MHQTSVPQIDNAAYAVGLSERVRTRVEKFGRVELRDTEAAVLVRSKAVHVVLLMAAVFAGLLPGVYVTFLTPLLAFWLGGVAEAATTPGTGAAEKIKGTGAAVLGLIGFYVLFQVVFFKFA